MVKKRSRVGAGTTTAGWGVLVDRVDRIRSILIRGKVPGSFDKISAEIIALKNAVGNLGISHTVTAKELTIVINALKRLKTVSIHAMSDEAVRVLNESFKLLPAYSRFAVGTELVSGIVTEIGNARNSVDGLLDVMIDSIQDLIKNPDNLKYLNENIIAHLPQVAEMLENAYGKNPADFNGPESMEGAHPSFYTEAKTMRNQPSVMQHAAAESVAAVTGSGSGPVNIATRPTLARAATAPTLLPNVQNESAGNGVRPGPPIGATENITVGNAGEQPKSDKQIKKDAKDAMKKAEKELKAANLAVEQAKKAAGTMEKPDTLNGKRMKTVGDSAKKLEIAQASAAEKKDVVENATQQKIIDKHMSRGLSEDEAIAKSKETADIAAQGKANFARIAADKAAAKSLAAAAAAADVAKNAKAAAEKAEVIEKSLAAAAAADVAKNAKAAAEKAEVIEKSAAAAKAQKAAEKAAKSAATAAARLATAEEAARNAAAANTAANKEKAGIAAAAKKEEARIAAAAAANKEKARIAAAAAAKKEEARIAAAAARSAAAKTAANPRPSTAPAARPSTAPVGKKGKK